MQLKFAAIVVAAGRGSRFGQPKQFILLAGKPMVAWSLQTFAAFDDLGSIVVATERDWIERMRSLLESIGPRCPWSVVAGGASRQESVGKALAAVPDRCNAVLIHDGARPLVRGDDVRAGMAAISPGRAAVLAAQMVDTIKEADARGTFVKRTLRRERLWAAQTPQFAMKEDLIRAHDLAQRDGFDATDDAALLEHAGVKIALITSSIDNFKVTTPDDAERADAMLQRRLHPGRR